jgi:hypothetical protein
MEGECLCNVCRGPLDYHGITMGFQFCELCWSGVLRGLREDALRVDTVTRATVEAQKRSAALPLRKVG